MYHNKSCRWSEKQSRFCEDHIQEAPHNIAWRAIQSSGDFSFSFLFACRLFFCMQVCNLRLLIHKKYTTRWHPVRKNFPTMIWLNVVVMCRIWMRWRLWFKALSCSKEAFSWYVRFPCLALLIHDRFLSFNLSYLTTKLDNETFRSYLYFNFIYGRYLFTG